MLARGGVGSSGNSCIKQKDIRAEIVKIPYASCRWNNREAIEAGSQRDRRCRSGEHDRQRRASSDVRFAPRAFYDAVGVAFALGEFFS